MNRKEKNKTLKIDDMDKCIGCYACMLACARTVYGDYSPAKSAIRIKSNGGLQGKFVADICRGCESPNCAKVCFPKALTPRMGGGIVYNSNRCTGCRKCVQACPVQAIGFDERGNKPILCIQCGTCVKNCPQQVLTMEVRSECSIIKE